MAQYQRKCLILGLKRLFKNCRLSYLVLDVHTGREQVPRFDNIKDAPGTVVVVSRTNVQVYVHAVHIEQVNMW
jgi:hypothetical protein